MKTLFWILKFLCWLGLWIVLGTVADFTYAMWQTWVIIILLAAASSFSKAEEQCK